jgi:urease accessory protein
MTVELEEKISDALNRRAAKSAAAESPAAERSVARSEQASKSGGAGFLSELGSAGPGAAVMSHDSGPEGPKAPGEVHSGWRAALRLEFATQGSRTVLARRSHEGPLVVQRAFYPEGDVCHIYIVHPPGGVVGGDVLELKTHAADGSHVLITTPAATKFYRSNRRVAHQTQDIELDAATFEWLPQETILFPDSYASIATRARLTKRSRFIGWEIVCYGRPASDMPYASGRTRQDFEIWVDDAPVVLDHLRVDGASATMSAPFGLAGHTVLGTMFAFPADDALVALARSVTTEGVVSACTKVDGVLVCRAAGAHADRVRHVLAAVWRAIRPTIANRPAVPPRIWST